MATGGSRLVRSAVAASGAWKSTCARREQFEKAAKVLNIANWPQDWYAVTRTQLYRSCGSSFVSILNYHHSSIVIALLDLFPEHDWKPWKFKRTPSRIWAQRAFRRAYFDSLSTELQLKTLDDWYRVTYSQVLKHGGAGLLAVKYNDSLIQALKDVYPDHAWLEWRFAQMPPDFLDVVTNQTRLLDWAAEQLGIRQRTDWYDIEASTVSKLPGGATLLDRHSSLYNALCAAYPDHIWRPWLFRFASPLMWQNKPTRKLFADSLANESRTLADLSNSDIEKVPGGSGWLRHYGGSLPAALNDLFPESCQDNMFEV